MLERCRRCVRLFLRPTTAQLTGLRCCNPEASSCLTCRRSWRCATTNPLSAGDWAAWLGTKKLSDELIVPNLDQNISGPLLMELNQRCFASLNMTRSSKDEA